MLLNISLYIHRQFLVFADDQEKHLPYSTKLDGGKLWQFWRMASNSSKFSYKPLLCFSCFAHQSFMKGSFVKDFLCQTFVLYGITPILHVNSY